MAHKLEGSIHEPGLSTDQGVKLLLAGKYKMASLLHFYIGLEESWWETVLDQLEVKISRMLGAEFLSKAVRSSCQVYRLREGWARSFRQFIQQDLVAKDSKPIANR